MAHTGQEIFNRLTGERLVFRQTASETGGAQLSMESHWTRPGHRAAEHVHPEMEERFTVLTGTAALRIAGVDTTLATGDSVAVAPGTRHLAWNPGSEPVHLLLEMRPALRWEDFAERLFELSSTDDAVKAGHPDPALLADLLTRFPREIALP